MILDTLAHAGLYRGLVPRIELAFDYLVRTDLTRAVVGRIDLDGDHAYAMVQEYQTKPAERGIWEAHRKYLDVQYVVSGVERMGCANISRMTVTHPYDAGRDFEGFSGQGDFMTLRAGDFTVFLPQDVHMPQIAPSGGEPALVRKVVVKVRVS